MVIRFQVKKDFLRYLVLGVSLFLLPNILRTTLLNSELYASINVLFWISFMLCVSDGEKKSAYEIKITLRKILIISAILLVVLFYTIGVMSYTNVNHYIEYIICTFIPIGIIFTKAKDTNVQRFSETFYLFLKIAVHIIVICGIIDLFTSYRMTMFFANYYDVESFYGMLNSSRMVSYMGHSLLTAGICLTFLVFNFVGYAYYEHSGRSYLWGIIVSIVGIALAASKTAIVLALIYLLLTNFSVKRIKYIIIGVIILYVFYRMGLFQVIIERFEAAEISGDISTGRGVDLQYLLNSTMYKFYMFTGNSSEITTKIDAAMEFPPIRWAYRFGIVTSVITSFFVYVYPLIRAIKSKQLNIVWSVLILVLFYNSNNAIANVGDSMTIFCVVMSILLNIAECQNKICNNLNVKSRSFTNRTKVKIGIND